MQTHVPRFFQRLQGLLSLVAILGACSPEPDFTTSQGVEVYTNGIEEITEPLVWRAIEFYAVRFSAESGLAEDQVRKSLSWVVLEWEARPFTCWYKKDSKWIEGLCNGTQDFEYLRVVWYSSIPDTVLFHEITHWIMQRVGLDDYAHSYKEFWDAEKSVNAEYREYLAQ